ncbi:MAG: hypothetical protein ACYCSP_14855 [Acidobacteriaceae bacterium]
MRSRILKRGSHTRAANDIDRMARVYGIAGGIGKLQIQNFARIFKAYINRYRPVGGRKRCVPELYWASGLTR